MTMSAQDAFSEVMKVRETLEKNNPPRDNDGFSRAWQVAITKLEESEMWLEKARLIEHDRQWDDDRD
jgi:hypothetical protein